MGTNKKIIDYIKENEKGLSGAVNRALEDLNNGDTLLLGGETLHFYQNGTTQKYYCISNNDKGDKNIVFSLSDKENITIDGEGAELIFHGEILPFVIDNCKNINIRNLNVDYASPIYAQAEILKAEENYFELQFDEKQFFCRERDGKIYVYNEEDGWEHEFNNCLTVEIDVKTGGPSSFKPVYITKTPADKNQGFLSKLFRYLTYKYLGNGRLAVSGDVGFVYTVGNYWIGTFDNRNNPGIFINNSKGISLEGINLYHALAMGVIGQNSEDITLDGVNTTVREGSGRLLSVCADSIHFVNCRGKIAIKNGLYTNMMDDAVNIHGIYHKFLRTEGTNRLYCGVGHFQQQGIHSYRPGDEIGIIDGNTGECKRTYKVKSSALMNEEEIWIETEDSLETIYPEDAIENLTANPEIEIMNCESGNNRPRGFLISSPQKILVENCIFYNMLEGINIGAGLGGWYESGAVSDVTIRNNEFKNSAYDGGVAINISPNFGDIDNMKNFNKGIIIEDNVFTQSEKRILYARATDNIVFRNNRFIKDSSLPHFPQVSDNGIKLVNCKNAYCEKILEEKC